MRALGGYLQFVTIFIKANFVLDFLHTKKTFETHTKSSVLDFKVLQNIFISWHCDFKPRKISKDG
jgi:hypothetical protein